MKEEVELKLAASEVKDRLESDLHSGEILKCRFVARGEWYGPILELPKYLGWFKLVWHSQEGFLGLEEDGVQGVNRGIDTDM